MIAELKKCFVLHGVTLVKAEARKLKYVWKAKIFPINDVARFDGCLTKYNSTKNDNWCYIIKQLRYPNKTRPSKKDNIKYNVTCCHWKIKTPEW